jgi:hypothetical protein
VYEATAHYQQSYIEFRRGFHSLNKGIDHEEEKERIHDDNHRLCEGNGHYDQSYFGFHWDFVFLNVKIYFHQHLRKFYHEMH